MKRLYLYGAGALVLSGLALGWYIFSPKPSKPETYAPAVVQADRSLIVEKIPQPDAKPKAQIPKGAKVERIVRFEVKPLDIPPQDALDGSGPVEGSCPSLDVELSLVDLPDDSKRVVLLSKRGEILNAVDIPVKGVKEYKPPKWSVGALYNPLDARFGVEVERRLWGPFKAGVLVLQGRDTPVEAWGKIAIEF